MFDLIYFINFNNLLAFNDAAFITIHSDIKTHNKVKKINFKQITCWTTEA